MDPEIVEHLLKHPGSLRLNAGNKPIPRMQKPLTRSEKLVNQARRLEEHLRIKWEKEMTERRSRGQEIMPFPGVEAVKDLKPGQLPATGILDTEPDPPAGTTDQAFEEIAQQSTEK